MHYLPTSFALALCFVFLSLLPHTRGQTLYWDTNGTTAGSTNIRNTWLNDDALAVPWWSTSAAGTTTTTYWTPGATAVFSAGSNATGSTFVDIGAGVNVSSIFIEEGDINFNGAYYGGSFVDLSAINVAPGKSAILNATLTESAGGAPVTLTKAGSGSLDLIAPNSTTGGVNITGGLVMFNSIANIGSGPISVSNGAYLATPGILETNQQVTVTDSSSQIQAVGYIEIGDVGDGNLTLSSGGSMSSDSSVAFGVNTGVTGIGNVTGSGSVLNSTTDLFLGFRGSGILSIGSGGHVNVRGNLRFGEEAGSSGTLNLLSGGTLAIEGSNAIRKGLGTAALNFSGGTLEVLGADLSFSLPVALGSGTTSTVDTSGQNATLSGEISGSGTLAKSGSGTLFITGSNTYTGGTILNAGTLILSGTNSFGAGTAINGGTLQIAADANLGSLPASPTPSHLSLDGGTLATTASLTLSENRGIALGTSGGTLNTTAGTTLTYGGILAGSGALIKAGTGTLSLSGANSYSGGTVISAGTLSGNTSSLQGDIINHGSLVFEQSSPETFSGNLSGTGSLTKAGSEALSLSGNNNYSGNTSVATGTLHLASPGSIYGGVRSNWNRLTVGNSGSLSVNVAAGGFASEDVAALLNQANFASGLPGLEIDLSEGLNVAEDFAIDFSETTTPGAALRLTANNQLRLNEKILTLATASQQELAVDLLFTGGNTGLTGGTYTNANGWTVLDGGPGGAGGTINITGGNITFDQAVNLKGGVGGLSASGTDDGGPGGIGGTVLMTQGNTTVNQSLDLSGGLGGGTPFLSNRTGGQGGNGGNGGSLTIADGIFNLSSGASIVLAGGQGRGGEDVGGNGGNGGFIDLQGGTLNAAVSANIDLSGGSLGTGSLSDGSADGDDGADGTFRLTGGTLQLPSLGWLETPSNLSGDFNFSAGTLATTDSDESLSLDASSKLGLSLADTQVTLGRTLDLAADLVYSGLIAGSGSLTKTGVGNFTLTGANTFTGDTHLDAGTLTLSNSDALQNSTLILGQGSLNLDTLDALNLGGACRLR